MVINGVKDLAKVIALCRKEGVTAIKIDGIELSLGPLPTKQTRTAAKATLTQTIVPGGIDESIQIPAALTDEQLLFWSAQSTETPEHQ